MNKILVTGCAGFIGFHLTQKLLSIGKFVVGIDNLNDYYDVGLKKDRLKTLGISNFKKNKNLTLKSENKNFKFFLKDISDNFFVSKMMKTEKFDAVINLAAQAGVRYSLVNPQKYIDSNINGFLNIIEGCRHNQVKHLIYASTSSVYGLNEKMPLSEEMSTEHPISLYAATKKSNEMIAHSYSHLFDIPSTGLRFFTVYGPWGRPDMALFLFTDAIIKDKPIELFNYGKMVRDFTYVSDIVESIVRLIDKPPKSNFEWNASKPRTDTSSAPYTILNIGNSKPVDLKDYIKIIEKELNKKAKINLRDIQPGDVIRTEAKISKLEKLIKYSPNIGVEQGVKNFVNWYCKYYKIKF